MTQLSTKDSNRYKIAFSLKFFQNMMKSSSRINPVYAINDHPVGLVFSLPKILVASGEAIIAT